MSIALIGSGIVRIQKPHRCWGCNKTQEKGTVMYKETQVDDGEVVHFYFCQPCREWLDNNTDHWDRADWETLTQGDIGDFRAEEITTKGSGEGDQYPEASRQFKQPQREV